MYEVLGLVMFCVYCMFILIHITVNRHGSNAYLGNGEQQAAVQSKQPVTKSAYSVSVVLDSGKEWKDMHADGEKIGQVFVHLNIRMGLTSKWHNIDYICLEKRVNCILFSCRKVSWWDRERNDWLIHVLEIHNLEQITLTIYQVAVVNFSCFFAVVSVFLPTIFFWAYSKPMYMQCPIQK